MKKLLVIICSIAILASCDDDDDVRLTYEEQLKVDIEKIENYLSRKGLTADSTETGLFYIIDEEGTGSRPTVDSLVSVRYVGKFLETEEVFDSGTTEDYPLGGFIYGWREGIALFKEGGSGTLYIPSSLGYGAIDYYAIPANSVLIFEVELLDVKSNEAAN
jgi:FKBP-type peptidyl-prolyl cis-trans isomerase FkpA